MENLISALEAAKLIGVSKKVIYDSEELRPALLKPRVYRLEDVREFAKQFERTSTGTQVRRRRNRATG